MTILLFLQDNEKGKKNPIGREKETYHKFNCNQFEEK